jgi:hypothetical protein
VLLDAAPHGDHVVVSAIVSAALSGKPASVQALSGFQPLGSPVSATVGTDGTFRASIPLPANVQRASVRYRATVAGQRSRTLKLERKLLIVSRHVTSAGTRITGRLVSGGRHKITIARLSCTTSTLQSATHTSRSGTFSASLPRPTAAEGTALYRAGATIHGSRTYSLPILVRR